MFDSLALLKVMEKICSIACFIVGAVFFVVALFGVWRHLLTMSVCVAVGLLAKEEKD